jgi:hypothetical protein
MQLNRINNLSQSNTPILQLYPCYSGYNAREEQAFRDLSGFGTSTVTTT